MAKPSSCQHIERCRVEIRSEGEDHYHAIIDDVPLDCLVAGSEYVRRLENGWSIRADGDPVRIVIPRYITPHGTTWHEVLIDVITGEPFPCMDHALRLWRALDFLGATDALDRAARHIESAFSKFWSNCSTLRSGECDLVEIALTLYTLHEIREREVFTAPPDATSLLFSTAKVWSCSPIKDRSAIMRYAGFGAEIVQRGAGAFGPIMNGILTEMNSCLRPDVLSLAVVRALRDWHMPLRYCDPYFAEPHRFALCDVFSSSLAQRLVVASEGPFRGVSCLVASMREFEAALLDDHPRTATAAMECAFRTDPDSDFGGTVLAGGSVVNAMQDPALGKRLPGSDLDLWVFGKNHTCRKRAFKRTVKALFKKLPQCTARVLGPVATFTLPPESGCDPSRHESVQVVFTDCRHPGDVVAGFDLDHACAFADNIAVHCTWECLASLVSRTTRPVHGATPRQARVDKASAKGFTYVGNGELDGGSPDVHPLAFFYGRSTHSEPDPKRRRALSYSDPHDLIRDFAYVPMGCDWQAHRNSVPMSKTIHGRRYIWAQQPVCVALPPMVVEDVFLPEERTNGFFSLGLAMDEEQNHGRTVEAMRDVASAERALYGLAVSKANTNRDFVRLVYRWSRKEPGWEGPVDIVWKSFVSRIKTEGSFTPVVRVGGRSDCDLRDGLTGTVLHPSAMKPGYFVTGHVFGDGICISPEAEFRPLLRAASLRVYPSHVFHILHVIDR